MNREKVIVTFLRCLMIGRFFIACAAPALIVASSYASTLVTVRDGGRLALSCDARGVPRPTIAWMHNSSFAMPSANFSTGNLTDKVTRSILTVQRVSLNDSGVYSCHASNALGQDSTIQTVIVQGMHVAFVRILLYRVCGF